jgi:aspartyl/asparaginyl beta-hydroxylase (cupin superfamily)
MLPWAAKIEAAAPDIRAEYLAAIAGGAQMSPYVDANTRDPAWRDLRGRLDWSSLHLYRSAEETPFAKAFPKTLKALEAADIPRVDDGKPIEMFFSRLLPGAHIPPHCGAANNRITVHLPLIVPNDCAIRVGDAIHVWREGELFAFDDSFEHEAWNRSGAERVVLIFEAHHPDLRLEERQAIELAFEMRGRWRRERRIPAA